MNPYAFTSPHNSIIHDQNHLSRMLQIPVPHSLTPTITNSAMRALGSITQANSIHNGPMGSNSTQDHDRIAVNPVTLDHHNSGRVESGSSGNPTPDPSSHSSSNNNSSSSRQNTTAQSSSSTTLELHPDIVLENFFEETDDRPHICQVCNACYKTRTHLKRHMCVHLKARPYTCTYPDCGKGFNRKEHLNKHQDAVHRLSKFKCDYCGKEISRKDHLNRHIKNMHTSPLPPGGTRRGQGGGSHRKKKGNSTAANGLRQLTSGDEGKVETNRFQMSNTNTLGNPEHDHHHYEGNFPNGKGPGAGTAPGLLELFTCRECTATFVTENDLAIHSKTHKPQPYKCSECSRAYTRREKLAEHVRCFHQGQKFTCEYCGKDLSRKDHVLRHVRSVHPEVLASHFVEMGESNGDTTVVINSRTNNSVPTTSSSSNSGSNNSIPSMGEMGALLKSVCHICLKVFGTSYHLARHVQSVHNQHMRPYTCSFCSKQFKRKDHLTNHMKSHCPSHRDGGSPNSSQLNTVNSLDMGNLLLPTNSGSVSLRQHPLNSLQIEMLSPEDDNKTEGCDGNNRGRIGQKSETNDLKFLKSESKVHRNSCEILQTGGRNHGQPHGNTSIHSGGTNVQSKRSVKESQQQSTTDFKLNLNIKEQDSSNVIGGMNQTLGESGRRSSVDTRSNSPSKNTFCGHCQLKFNSEEELIGHLQKHGENNVHKDTHFMHCSWERVENNQNQHATNRS